jgi:hypothetical protein
MLPRAKFAAKSAATTDSPRNSGPPGLNLGLFLNDHVDLSVMFPGVEPVALRTARFRAIEHVG